MAVSERLLEIREYLEPGYRPVVDYESWRVAILNYIDDLSPDQLTAMQRHNETDEVFVLLKGRCILFLGDGKDTVTAIYAQDLEPLKVYNVKRGTWHTHTLSEDAQLLIVENRDTTFDNSPFCSLDSRQRQDIINLTESLWL